MDQDLMVPGAVQTEQKDSPHLTELALCCWLMFKFENK